MLHPPMLLVGWLGHTDDAAVSPHPVVLASPHTKGNGGLPSLRGPVLAHRATLFSDP